MRTFNCTTIVVREITDAEYDLIYQLQLRSDRIKAIKFIKSQHNLGLIEAKRLCETIWDTPYMIQGESRNLTA